MEATGWLRKNSRIWGVVSKATVGCLTWYRSLTAVDYHVGADITKKTTAFAPGPSRWNTQVFIHTHYSARGHRLLAEVFPFVETLYNATIAESSESSRKGQRVF